VLWLIKLWLQAPVEGAESRHEVLLNKAAVSRSRQHGVGGLVKNGRSQTDDGQL
jgi:hypothetical protein